MAQKHALNERANPTLATILEIEGILEDGSREGEAMPMTMSEFERRMSARRTRHDTIKAAIGALVHYGVAAVGSKGVIYVRTLRKVGQTPHQALV